MTSLSLIAILAAMAGIAIGFASIMGEAGYSFDLRRRNRRGARDGRVGGRRSVDHVAA
jgi:hypothetical protein